MVYRKATKEDLKEILKLKKIVKDSIIKEGLQIWLHGYPEDKLIIDDVVNGEGRVIEKDGVILGYANCHLCLTEYPKGTFKSDNIQCFGRLMVAPENRGKKVGYTLINGIIEESKTLGVEGVGVLVDACNERAIHLYKKFGFAMENQATFKFSEVLTVVLDIYAIYF